MLIFFLLHFNFNVLKSLMGTQTSNPSFYVLYLFEIMSALPLELDMMNLNVNINIIRHLLNIKEL